MKRSLLVLISTAMADLGCATEPSSCDEASCDGEREYCMLYGSDTMAPSTAGCHELPAACAAAPSCDCIEGEEDNLGFCFEAGGCDEPPGGAVAIVCPGG